MLKNVNGAQLLNIKFFLCYCRWDCCVFDYNHASLFNTEVLNFIRLLVLYVPQESWYISTQFFVQHLGDWLVYCPTVFIFVMFHYYYIIIFFLKSWTKHFQTCLFFSTICLYHKWNGIRLLSPQGECKGSLTSCRTT